MATVNDWRDDRIGAVLRGTNPTVLARLEAGFAVIGDVQFLPGYCVLLTERIGVDRLSDLPRRERLAFLSDLDRLATAVEVACAAVDPLFSRVNLEILGNRDPFLHAHVWPRYGWEDAALRTRPVWSYPPSHWSDPDHALSERHGSLRALITAELAR